VRLFVFLGAGARGLLDGRRWPAPEGDGPGAWVDGDERFPVRAYPVEELPHWLDDELWGAELDGPTTPGDHSLTAPRGRLTERIAGWDASVAAAFVDAVTERARSLALRVLRAEGHAAPAAAIADATPHELVAVCDAVAVSLEGVTAELAAFPADCVRYAEEAHSPGAAAAVAGYIAAHAAGRHAVDYEAGAGAERAWQARWLAKNLRLGDPGGAA
jgi:hypothetical protein